MNLASEYEGLLFSVTSAYYTTNFNVTPSVLSVPPNVY